MYANTSTNTNTIITCDTQVLLASSTSVLIGGMIFESSQLAEGSVAYLLMTVIVGGVIVASVGLFLRMLVIESRRTCKKRASPPSGNVSGGGGGGGGGEGSGGSSGGGATGSSPLHLRARVARMSAFASSTRGKLTGHLASSSGMAPNAEVLSERFGAPRIGPPGAVDATTSTMRMQLNPLAAVMDRRRASAALPPNTATRHHATELHGPADDGATTAARAWGAHR